MPSESTGATIMIIEEKEETTTPALIKNLLNSASAMVSALQILLRNLDGFFDCFVAHFVFFSCQRQISHADTLIQQRVWVCAVRCCALDFVSSAPQSDRGSLSLGRLDASSLALRLLLSAAAATSSLPPIDTRGITPLSSSSPTWLQAQVTPLVTAVQHTQPPPRPSRRASRDRRTPHLRDWTAAGPPLRPPPLHRISNHTHSNAFSFLTVAELSAVVAVCRHWTVAVAVVSMRGVDGCLWSMRGPVCCSRRAHPDWRATTLFSRIPIATLR